MVKWARKDGHPETYEQAIDSVLNEMRSIMLAKQHDYGSKNIATFGETGVLVRANDKIERLINLLWTKRTQPKNESIEDSWLDLANYSVLALMARRGWIELPVAGQDGEEDNDAS